MKIYIVVTEGSQDYSQIRKAFTNREDAEKYASTFSVYAGACIEETELEIPTKLEKALK